MEQTQAQTQTTEVNLSELNFDLSVKSQELVSSIPALSQKETKVIVVGFGEERLSKTGINIIPVVLAQKTVIENGGTPSNNALSFFMGYDNSRLLRTVQNMKADMANSFSIGDELPENFNLELHRSITPFEDKDGNEWGNQKEVKNPETGKKMGYYQNTVVVAGKPNHQPIPEIPNVD